MDGHKRVDPLQLKDGEAQNTSKLQHLQMAYLNIFQTRS